MKNTIVYFLFICLILTVASISSASATFTPHTERKKISELPKNILDRIQKSYLLFLDEKAFDFSCNSEGEKSTSLKECLANRELYLTRAILIDLGEINWIDEADLVFYPEKKYHAHFYSYPDNSVQYKFWFPLTRRYGYVDCVEDVSFYIGNDEIIKINVEEVCD
jgi:hypothetical protein